MTTSRPEATDYQRVSNLFVHAHSGEGASRVLQAADALWPTIRMRNPSAEDAEICRLTMLAATYAGDRPLTRLWKTRALARFTSIGWREGVAALIMGDAFLDLAHANNDYSDGHTIDVLKPSTVALGILDEIEPFTRSPGTSFALGPGSPSTAVLERLFYEKRGFLLLLAGDFQSARMSYERALNAAKQNVRGTIKVRLGLALVDYLAPGGREQAHRLADYTAALADAATSARSEDLAHTASENADAMRRSSTHLLPYEIL